MLLLGGATTTIFSSSSSSTTAFIKKMHRRRKGQVIKHVGRSRKEGNRHIIYNGGSPTMNDDYMYYNDNNDWVGLPLHVDQAALKL